MMGCKNHNQDLLWSLTSFSSR